MTETNDAVNDYSPTSKGLFYQLTGIKQLVEKYPTLLDDLGLSLEDLGNPAKVLDAIQLKEHTFGNSFPTKLEPKTFGSWGSKESNELDRTAVLRNNSDQLSLHHDLYTFLSKLDPDLCYYSGIRYKSELDDCGISVDGHAKGNGWKIRVSWENETTVLWSPNLKALLNSTLDFLKEKVKS